MFLTREEISHLTGRKMKGAQIKALQKMYIPYLVNATGHAIITKAAIEGRSQKANPKTPRSWSPKVLNER